MARVPFADHSKHRAALRSSSRFIVRTDIANCYSSIYTHSIPWALHTKTKAKRFRKPNALFGNQLDRLLRDSQDGQTIGIPIGPDTSFVISEMLLSAVDAEFCTRLSERGLRANGFRSYDDFEFGFENRADAEAAIALLQSVLGEFELQLNPSKTAILELPIPLEAPWVSEIRAFPIDLWPNRWGIDRYFDRAFELCRLFPDSEILKYSVQRFRAAEVLTDDWPHLENLLLQCAMAEPSSLSAVVDHLHYYRRESRYQLDAENVQRVLNLLIGSHATLGHGSEVAWALWGCLLFRLKVDDESALAVAKMDDPFVMLLLLHACRDGLARGGLVTRKWRSALSVEGLYGELWPFAYEVNAKGWVSTKTDFVSSDPAFSQLKAGNVSFYDASRARDHMPSKRRTLTLHSGGGYPLR